MVTVAAQVAVAVSKKHIGLKASRIYTYSWKLFCKNTYKYYAR